MAAPHAATSQQARPRPPQTGQAPGPNRRQPCPTRREHAHRAPSRSSRQLLRCRAAANGWVKRRCAVEAQAKGVGDLQDGRPGRVTVSRQRLVQPVPAHAHPPGQLAHVLRTGDHAQSPGDRGRILGRLLQSDLQIGRDVIEILEVVPASNRAYLPSSPIVPALLVPVLLGQLVGPLDVALLGGLVATTQQQDHPRPRPVCSRPGNPGRTSVEAPRRHCQPVWHRPDCPQRAGRDARRFGAGRPDP